jgi:hypothetical protein
MILIGVLIGFYLPCERTSLGPIITKPISKDIPTYPWTASPIEVPPVLKNKQKKRHLFTNVALTLHVKTTQLNITRMIM